MQTGAQGLSKTGNFQISKTGDFMENVYYLLILLSMDFLK